MGYAGLLRVPIIIGFLLFQSNSFGMSTQNLIDFSQYEFPTKEIQEYCQKDFFSHARSKAQHLAWRINEENESGTLGIGNCWWHSALQRHAFYRVVMRPDLSASLNRHQPRQILKRLARNKKEVVEIPGFRTFGAFTYYYGHETLKTIDQMHVWMNGIEEILRLPPLGAALNRHWTKLKVEELKDRIQNNEIPLINFNPFGTFIHHSFLVTDYSEENSTITFKVINPNTPKHFEYFIYSKLDGFAHYTLLSGKKWGDGRMGMNLMRNEEYKFYIEARNRYCEQKKSQ